MYRYFIDILVIDVLEFSVVFSNVFNANISSGTFNCLLCEFSEFSVLSS